MCVGGGGVKVALERDNICAGREYTSVVALCRVIQKPRVKGELLYLNKRINLCMEKKLLLGQLKSVPAAAPQHGVFSL